MQVRLPATLRSTKPRIRRQRSRDHDRASTASRHQAELDWNGGPRRLLSARYRSSYMQDVSICHRHDLFSWPGRSNRPLVASVRPKRHTRRIRGRSQTRHRTRLAGRRLTAALTLSCVRGSFSREGSQKREGVVSKSRMLKIFWFCIVRAFLQERRDTVQVRALLPSAVLRLTCRGVIFVHRKHDLARR
jgi:hypothetical protein